MGSSFRIENHAQDRLPVQVKGESTSFWRERLHATRKSGATIPRSVAEAAWLGYDADGHGSQSCKRIHERGGFGLAEIGYYIARAVDEERVNISKNKKIHYSEDPWFQILVSAVDPEMSFESVEDMRAFILTSMENEHRRTNPT